MASGCACQECGEAIPVHIECYRWISDNSAFYLCFDCGENKIPYGRCAICKSQLCDVYTPLSENTTKLCHQCVPNRQFTGRTLRELNAVLSENAKKLVGGKYKSLLTIDAFFDITPHTNTDLEMAGPCMSSHWNDPFVSYEKKNKPQTFL
jgi:hypothetical protein